MFLDGLGHDVTWAGSGMTALISAKSAYAEVILIDVALPDMEGPDLCCMFRKLDETRGVPIILLANHGYTPESFRRPIDLPDDFIEKPFAELELSDRISAILKAKAEGLLIVHKAAPVEPPKAGSQPIPSAEPAPKPVQRPVLKLVPKTGTSVPAATPEVTKAVEVVDPATGLFSRQQFEAMFSKAFKQCQRFKQQMSCILIDLDGTKMGRTVDNDLVKAIVALVQTTIREVDTAAWWTGESLIVLLPNTLRNDAVHAAARVLEAVANHPFTWPDATRVTMSIGVAGLPDVHIDTEEKLIEAAARASRKALDSMVSVPKSLEGLVQARNEVKNPPVFGEKKK